MRRTSDGVIAKDHRRPGIRSALSVWRLAVEWLFWMRMRTRRRFGLVRLPDQAGWDLRCRIVRPKWWVLWRWDRRVQYELPAVTILCLR